MPQEQEEFQRAVRKILEIVMFENWLRFYFIAEDNNTEDASLRIELPEKSMQKIKELYPSLYPLAESMNNREVDFDISRRSVLTHVMDKVDGKDMPRGMAQIVFSSSTFQKNMQLFHTWVQIHEEQLDQGFLDFGTWENLFFKWESSPAAKKILQPDNDSQSEEK